MLVAKTKQKRAKTTEGNYFLKLVIFLILGFFWIKIGVPGSWQIPIPIGLIIGLFLINSGRFKIDKKIDYAILLVAMLVGFWAPVGMFIAI